jgi:cytochrome oxidase Cu insertion factor (SCO1/SenC/PrrC family)
MQSGLNINNPMVAEAFRAALRSQLFVIAGIFLLLWLARLIAASWWPSPAQARSGSGVAAGQASTGEASKAEVGKGGAKAGVALWREPAARRVLRIGFGLIWIFDGILQAQPAMPLGLTSQVIQPSTDGAPGWVRHLVNWGATPWTYHPIPVATSAVWIQVGIGLWLLVGGQGRWNRLGALASVGWGLIVWVFGEAFGGIFSPGLTWLFGAPGAALFYCAAGVLLALPPGAWRSPRLGRLTLAGMGAFFAGMALLQAWPGRGFWQGTLDGQAGPLTSMIQSMAQTPQPHFMASLVSGFAGFVATHGFAVNLFTVIALAAIGVAFLSAGFHRGAGFGWGQPRLAQIGMWAGIVLCLADWVLVEDLGFFGGLGTDPNSMIPMALVFVCGYLAMTGATARSPEAEWSAKAAKPELAGSELAGTEQERQGRSGPEQDRPDGEQPGPAGPERDRPDAGPAGQRRGRLATLFLSGLRPVATASAGSIAALGALGVTLVGVLPAAAASTNPHADPIIAQAIDGTAALVNYRAAGFTLTDQNGAQVSLAGLHGKVVLLTFLDPVCTNDCPLIGREFAEAGRILAADSGRIRLAAIVASRTYRSVAVMQAYDRAEGLGHLPDWLYLTGTVPQLTKVWHDYAVAVQTLPAGAMTLHNDIAYVIDQSGQIRQVLNMDPGPGTSVSQSSFATQLAGAARQVLGER